MIGSPLRVESHDDDLPFRLVRAISGGASMVKATVGWKTGVTSAGFPGVVRRWGTLAPGGSPDLEAGGGVAASGSAASRRMKIGNGRIIKRTSLAESARSENSAAPAVCSTPFWSSARRASSTSLWYSGVTISGASAGK